MNYREQITLSAIFIGTVIGAGFASGQEILQFFTVYGKYGIFGIINSCFLFFLLGYVILKSAIKLQSISIEDILLPIAGKKLTYIFEIIVDMFLYIGFYIMISGCGAVLMESIKAPYYPVVVFLCGICIGFLKNGISGLGEFNRIMVPLMFFLMLLISFFAMKKIQAPLGVLNNAIPIKKGWFFSSLLYVSFNMTSTSVVLSSLGNFTTENKAAFKASLLASIVLFVLSVDLWVVTAVYFNQVCTIEIPLMYIAKTVNPLFYWASVIVLLGAMLTTALSYGFAFSRSLARKFNISYEFCVISLFLGLPFTGYGFSKSIKLFYPLFGIIGIIFMFVILIKKVFGF